MLLNRRLIENSVDVLLLLLAHCHLASIVCRFSSMNEELMLIYSKHRLMPFAIHETTQCPTIDRLQIKSQIFSIFEKEKRRRRKKQNETNQS